VNLAEELEDPFGVLLAHGFLKLASQKPQYCLKKSSRIPHRTIVEFVEFMEFIEFVGLKSQSAVEKQSAAKTS